MLQPLETLEKRTELVDKKNRQNNIVITEDDVGNKGKKGIRTDIKGVVKTGIKEWHKICKGKLLVELQD